MLLNNKKRFIQFLNFKHAVIAFLTVISVDIFAENAPPKITFEVKTFSIEGLLPVDKEIVETYLKPLQNQQYDLKKLQEVSSGLENLIREKGFAFHRVIIPPQTLNTGNVNLKIISFELGEIAVEGNHFFSNANISNSLPALQKNQDLNTNALSESIKVANKHPSKQIQLTFKQSELEDKIDATLNVKEQRPYQFYLIGNNIGSDNSGDYRLTGGAQYSNLWNLDHVVNFSYTTSPDHASDVKQYGANYSLPIYSLKGWLSAYYAYSSVNSGTIASSDFTVTGSGEMYGLHYQQFLPKFEQYEHSLEVGIDNRFYLNNIADNKNNQYNNTDVRSVPFSAMYRGEYPWESVHANYYVQWLTNTDFGGHNNNFYYKNSRSTAVQDWNAWRYGSNVAWDFEQWTLSGSFSAQQSHNALITGEQLGIGGSYDVRGYEQRETGADSGQIIKIELTTPAWHNANMFVFYDYGHGTNHNVQEDDIKQGMLKNWDLSSTGVGANFQWQEYFSGSITFANALDNAQTTQAGNNRIHANIMLRY